MTPSHQGFGAVGGYEASGPRHVSFERFAPIERPRSATRTLIGINVVVFLASIFLFDASELFLRAGFVPARFTWLLARFPDALLATVLPLFTATFLHAGWLHLFGNLVTLYAFGSPVEERLGRGRFLALYFLAGLAGNLAQWAAAPYSGVPLVGASGAIAGVLGAALLMFPRARVLAFLPIPFLFWPVEVSAATYLLVWLGLQVVNGLATLHGPAVGGVAWWAHLGGFVTGLLATLLLIRLPRRRRSEPRPVWPRPDPWYPDREV